MSSLTTFRSEEENDMKRISNIILRLLSVISLLMAAVMTLQAVPGRPSPQRLVNDYADIFTDEEENRLERMLVAFDDTTSNQITVVTVKDLEGYSNPVKAYLACNIELEKAMTYLMQRLEEQGIADKTAIVLGGDHFPYGLSYDSYSQLVGYEVNSFNKYKSSLIFWVGGLDETIYVDDYMCNIDILPTILNLWGFSYDSRLLAGTDIFSDSEHIAVLRNQSILNDKVWFNADNGKVTWLVDKSQVPEGYLDSLITLVKNRFALSKNILNEAYYNFVFKQSDVEIERDEW